MDNLLIGDFNGPLDLLLHLIKKSKVEIFDIEISDITQKYLSYINAMKDLNLDIASEYLIMAAELIEMKSRKLLPRKNEEETVNFTFPCKTAPVRVYCHRTHYDKGAFRCQNIFSLSFSSPWCPSLNCGVPCPTGSSSAFPSGSPL